MEPGVAQPTSELGQLRLELKALKDEAARWKKDAEQAAEFTEKKTYLDLLKSVNERIAALEARLPRITDAAPPPGILDKLTETLREGLERVQHELVEVKTLQRKASSATCNASTISEDDLTMVEGVLGIQWESEEDDPSGAAACQAEELGYEWDRTLHEAKQKKKYMEILELQVGVPPYMMWSEQVDRNDLLRTAPGTGGATELPFPIACRTDALIILAHAKLLPDTKIAATVELKKCVGQQSVRQAKATFICASLHSHMPVVSILTDMERTHMAFYHTDLEPGTNRRLCVQKVFSTRAKMCHFLHNALASVPSNALRFQGQVFNSVLQLENPPRKRLLPNDIQQSAHKEHSQHSYKAAMAALATHAAGGSDVARVDDLDDDFNNQQWDKVPGHMPCYS